MTQSIGNFLLGRLQKVGVHAFANSGFGLTGSQFVPGANLQLPKS